MKTKIILAFAIGLLSLSLAAQNCAFTIKDFNPCRKYTKEEVVTLFGTPTKVEEQENDGGSIDRYFSFEKLYIILSYDGYITDFYVDQNNTDYKVNNIVGIGDTTSKINQLNGLVKKGTFWGGGPCYFFYARDTKGTIWNSPIVFYETNGIITSFRFTVMN